MAVTAAMGRRRRRSFGVPTAVALCLVAVVAVAVAVLSLGVEVEGKSSGGKWSVEKQTKVQKAAYESLKAKAKEASEAATPALLAYLDSPEFRGNISNLPEEIKSLSSEDLLTLLNDTLLLSTITHGIPAAISGPVNPFQNLDISLQDLIALNLTFIPNLWERAAIGEMELNSSAVQEMIARVENLSEVEVFLLPNFTTSYLTPSFNESQNRISYGAMNLFRGAAGAQFYGSVQFVLRPAYYEDMMIVSPYDTGNYGFCCLSGMSWLMPSVCAHTTYPNGSCYEISLGTTKHWNHLFFQNQAYWEVPVLIALFQRLFAKPEPVLPVTAEGIYFEADLLGNLILPDAAQYVIGDFSSLFGKPTGQMVQNFCQSQGLPLIWALGLPNLVGAITPNTSIPIPMNQSVFDPTIVTLNITGMPNVTAPSSAVDWFQQAWQLVNTTLTENPATQNSTAFWYSFWDKFWGNLEELHFNPLVPGSCQDVKHCFGVDDTGDCYCRYPHDEDEEEEENSP